MLGKIDVIAYLACRMSGRSKIAMLKEANEAIERLSKFGIKCISPVFEEKVENVPGLLEVISEKDLHDKWIADKEFIKQCHVVIDLSAASPYRSEGAMHETLFARYALFKPIVRLFPKGLGPSITRFENAIIVQTLDEAGIEIITRYGTRYQRIMWRVRERIFWKWLKLIRLQFLGLFQ